MDIILNIIQSPFILFTIGALLIFYGSDILIDNSILIAKYYNISPVIIGLTVVAFGTSLPELIVSIMASIRDEGQIVLGNIIGSNIANISLVLAFIALYKNIIFSFTKIKTSIIYLFISTISLCLAVLYNKLALFTGIGFLLFFVFFIYGQFKNATGENNDDEASEEDSNIKYFIFIIIGIITLGYGSNLFIDSAIGIATFFNVPNIVISVSLVAFGTSVPELVTSIVALRKGEAGFVVGNILGSNIINILLVLGSSITINSILIDFSSVRLSFYFLIISTLIFILILFYQKAVTKVHGIVLLIIYCLFIYFQFSLRMIF